MGHAELLHVLDEQVIVEDRLQEDCRPSGQGSHCRDEAEDPGQGEDDEPEVAEPPSLAAARRLIEASEAARARIEEALGGV